MNETNEHLFVYGTLLRQSKTAMSSLLLSNSKFIDAATVQGILYDIGEYPGLILSNKSKDQVKGELFQLNNPDKLIKELDAYEGSEYRKVIASVYLKDGTTLKSWLYIFCLPTDTFTCIESGDYMSYLGLDLT